MRSLVAEESWKPKIFQIVTLVESTRCKIKDGFLSDTLDNVWPLVVGILNDAAAGTFSLALPNGSAWPPNTFYSKRAGMPICDGKFVFIIWIVTG